MAGAGSQVALPLRVRGQTIGVLDVHSTEPATFSDDDVGVLQILADQIAVALSNARLSRQVHNSAAAMRQAYGEMELETWRSLIRAHSELSVRHDPRGILGGSSSAHAAGCVHGQDDRSGLDERAVAVPIQIRGGHAIGVVRATKPDGDVDWHPEELELLRALVDQLGVALDGAQLYQESQERAERERLIAGIAARMRGSLDVDTVLRTAVREIGELMGFAEVEVRMVSHERDQA
jgi:GAF domain-containing protein